MTITKLYECNNGTLSLLWGKEIKLRCTKNLENIEINLPVLQDDKLYHIWVKVISDFDYIFYIDAPYTGEFTDLLLSNDSRFLQVICP
jgi:hypothetical protein